MADSDPYSRHYWRLVDDPKFLEIYGDDHHYATWSRLLMIADQAWPATAHLPALARKASIDKLASVKLIDLLPGGRFRMHGTEAERRKRSQQASNAAAVRWHSVSNADSNAETMPSKAEHRRAEQSIEETSTAPELGPSKEEGDVFSAIAQAGAFIRPETPMGQRVVGLIARRGAEAVATELARLVKAAGGPMSDRQIVFGLEEVLEKIPSPADARTEDVAIERDTRTQRMREQVHARRVEHFRWTGEWGAELGPEPEWNPDWGDRPGVAA